MLVKTEAYVNSIDWSYLRDRGRCELNLKVFLPSVSSSYSPDRLPLGPIDIYLDLPDVFAADVAFYKDKAEKSAKELAALKAKLAELTK